jgi:hypothetical protein
MASSVGDRRPVTLASSEGMIVERRMRSVAVPAPMLFRSFVRLGGERGWLAYNWAWYLRGALDRLFGGVGMRRGRRDPNDLRPGDSLDFWRVEQVVPGRMLRLRAEMKVPGRAWLQFEARPTGAAVMAVWRAAGSPWARKARQAATVAGGNPRKVSAGFRGGSCIWVGRDFKQIR